jgi:hypothetical protein
MNAEFKFLKAARRDVKTQASTIILYHGQKIRFYLLIQTVLKK